MIVIDKVSLRIFLQHMGSREGVAAKIEADTQLKIQEMNRSIQGNREQLIKEILNLVYDIKPELHKNYATRKI